MFLMGYTFTLSLLKMQQLLFCLNILTAAGRALTSKYSLSIRR